MMCVGCIICHVAAHTAVDLQQNLAARSKRSAILVASEQENENGQNQIMDVVKFHELENAMCLCPLQMKTTPMRVYPV